jgi:hypothetical protein
MLPSIVLSIVSSYVGGDLVAGNYLTQCILMRGLFRQPPFLWTGSGIHVRIFDDWGWQSEYGLGHDVLAGWSLVRDRFGPMHHVGV